MDLFNRISLKEDEVLILDSVQKACLHNLAVDTLEMLVSLRPDTDQFNPQSDLANSYKRIYYQGQLDILNVILSSQQGE